MVSRRSRKQRGVAAAELAIVLPVLISLLAFPLFLGKVYMHWSVMQKAAQNAALSLASTRALDMNDGRWGRAAEELAEAIAEETVRDLRPGGTGTVRTKVLCDGIACGFGRPQVVQVTVTARVEDDLLSFYTYVVGGIDGVLFTADVSVPYIGD